MLAHRVARSQDVGNGRRIIKQRQAKLTSDRIVLHDYEMRQAGLLPNSYFRCIMDAQTQTLMIVSAETGHKVSSTTRGTKEKPVIDLRNQAVRDLFAGARYFQVTIYDDCVEVSAYAETEGAAVAPIEAEEVAEEVAQPRFGRVTDITQLLRVKHLITASISRGELAQAVGNGSIRVQSLSHSPERGMQLRLFPGATPTPAPAAPLPFQAPIVAEYMRLMQEAMTAVSVFSGGGVLDFAFALAGFRTLFALEYDAQAVETYRANFGNHIVHADIRDFDLTQIPKTAVVFGGSPCVGFSQENRTTGGVGNPNNDLVERFIETVNLNDKCLVAVLENAPQLLTQGDGLYLERIKAGLKDFTITTGVMNALEYSGVMDRTRAVVIASKIGPIMAPAPTTTPENYRTVRWAWENLTDDVPDQLEINEWGEKTLERFPFIPEGGNWRDLPDHLRAEFHPNTHSNKFRRLAWDEPCMSMVNVRKTPVAHPSENRGPSVREQARVLGLPDRFRLRGSRSAKQLQLANAVCVHPWYHVAEEVAKAMKHHFMAEIGFRL